MADQAPALADLSDDELQSLATTAPPLHELSDQELGQHAVDMGLMQPEQFQAARAARNEELVGKLTDALFAKSPTPELAPLVKFALTKGGRIGDVAAQVLPPLAGAAAGTVVEPVGGTAAGGAAGGLAGDLLAQTRQLVRGEREKIGKTELATSAAAGAIPMGGRMLATPAKVVATRLLQGGGIATGLEAVRQLGDEGKLDFKGLATSGALGALFGAGAGTAETLATRRAVLAAIRKTPEFADFAGNDAELVSAVRERMTRPPTPAEPKNVTPEPAAAPLAKEGGVEPAATETPTVAPEGQPGTLPGQIGPNKPLAELSNEELLAVAKANPPPEQPELAGKGGKTVANETPEPANETEVAAPAAAVGEQPLVEQPRTAAMGAAAPRPTAGQQRVQAAQVQARADQQQASGLLPAASTLKKVVATDNAATWFRGARAIFAPQTLDEGAKQMSLILRSAFGDEYAAAQRADEALAQYRKEFDRNPVPRTWTYDPAAPLPHNYEVMSAIDSGRLGRLTPAETSFAETMRDLLDKSIDAVHRVSPYSLRELLENYFPRIWQEPEKNQAKINSLLSKRPLEGTKAFMKQRTLNYFTDGLKAGLVPVSDNPVDVVMQKLGEMQRFVMARQAMRQAKRVGLRKFKYVYEPMPEGWKPVDDPSSDVWKPPTVTVQEAFDAQLRAKTIEMLQELGIAHERTTKLGGQRWGEAVEGQGIKTKFGGPDFVFWHEAGHMLDWRFPDLRVLTGAMDRGQYGDEMRALADLRFENQPVTKSYKGYVRKTEEKIANMFDAYIRAPEKFQAVAPTVWSKFNEWLDQHPEVKRPLNEIKPSLTLGSDSKDMFVGGPIKLGDWIMPEGAAQVMTNYLQPGLGRYAAFRGLRDVSGLQNGLQLLGFFHGQLVGNDSFYSGIGLALYDALNGKPVRAAKELLQIPVSPFTSIFRGHQIGKAIRTPQTATATNRQIGQLAIEANLRAGHGPGEAEFTRQWLRAIRELRQSPNTGAAWESFWRAPLAGLELAMAPVMRGLVPAMKRGIFARMAERVMSDNPGADLATLRGKLAEAADATEDRLGQVTYDNLFQNRVLKDAMQLLFRAYGWQLTKYRMIAGGAADWGRATRDAASGKKPNVTFRMSYLPAMVVGHMMLGATYYYLMNGKRPEKPMDYFFPANGLKDAQGRPMRVALADFVKDVIADWRNFPSLNKMGAEWTHKLAPFWNVAAELYQNRDFYGTEILSDKQVGEPEIDHLLKNFKEGAEFFGKNALPFGLQAAKKYQEAGASTAASYVAPALGFVPAPRYAINTPMQNFLSDQAGLNQYTRTAEQAQQSQLARGISTALRTHQPLTPEQQKAMGTLSKQQLNQAERRAYMDPDVWAVRALDLDRGMQAWDLANAEERTKITPTLRLKIGRALESGGEREKLVRYLRLLNRPAQ